MRAFSESQKLEITMKGTKFVVGFILYQQWFSRSCMIKFGKCRKANISEVL